MKVINFFGGPCAGKSTSASGLFYEMKKHWIKAEYIQEYAKELVWSDSTHMLSEQNYIFAEQEHRLNRVRNKVDFAISDSPLLLSAFYAPPQYKNSFNQCVFDFFNTYENINIFVRRSHEYSLEGRLQNQEDADKISMEMEIFLQNNNIPYWSIVASNASPKRLLYWLVKEHNLVIPDGIDLDMEKDDFPKDWMEYHPTSSPWKSGDKIIRARLEDVLTVGEPSI